MCQDTGTAIVMGKRGQQVLTAGPRRGAPISRGVFDAYRAAEPALLADGAADDVGGAQHRDQPAGADRALRRHRPGHELAYKFLFMAKGGGSANKTYLFQETKAVLNPAAFSRSWTRSSARLGTAACPPYHLAVVIGGTCAEFALKTAKYACARYLDSLPVHGIADGHGFRDLEMEAEVLQHDPGLRHRRPVRRQVLLPRRPRRSGCRGTAPRARSPSPCRARRTGRRWPRSRRRACSSSSSRPTRRGSCPTSPTSTSTTTSCASTCDRPMAEIRPSCPRCPVKTRRLADRPAGRRPRHRARPDPGDARTRRADAGLPARPRRLLRRARPRRPRATPPDRSGRPPPAAWTPTSTGSRRPAARS